MSKLITTDEQLTAHLPNIVNATRDETPLIRRIATFLDLAEDWVRCTFTSDATFNTICGYTDAHPTRQLCSRLIVADAMLRAIPSLDIVLTPNGFGVVNSTNIAPASKPRIDRLIGSMQQHRDDCIAALLPALVGASKWLASEQAEFFGATLFPDLTVVDAVGNSDGQRWHRYLELRSQLIDLEATLAEQWFSPELMSELRYGNLRGDLTGQRGTVVRQIKAQLTAVLRGGSFNHHRLAEIVNHIRQCPKDFPLWHSSATAQLFTPPVFRNRQGASGYFF